MSVPDEFLEVCLDLNIQVTNIPLDHVHTGAVDKCSNVTRWYLYSDGKYVGSFIYYGGQFDINIEYVGEGTSLPLEVVVLWLQQWTRFFSPTGQTNLILKNMITRMCQTVTDMLEREHNPEMRLLILEEKQRMEALQGLRDDPYAFLALL